MKAFHHGQTTIPSSLGKPSARRSITETPVRRYQLNLFIGQILTLIVIVITNDTRDDVGYYIGITDSLISTKIQKKNKNKSTFQKLVKHWWKDFSRPPKISWNIQIVKTFPTWTHSFVKECCTSDDTKTVFFYCTIFYPGFSFEIAATFDPNWIRNPSTDQH